MYLISVNAGYDYEVCMISQEGSACHCSCDDVLSVQDRCVILQGCWLLKILNNERWLYCSLSKIMVKPLSYNCNLMFGFYWAQKWIPSILYKFCCTAQFNIINIYFPFFVIWYCQCLFSVVGSSYKVIVWFPTPMWYGSVFICIYWLSLTFTSQHFI